MNTVLALDEKSNNQKVTPPTPPPSRQRWTEHAAAAVRYLRRGSKPFSEEPLYRWAENRLWESAETIAAAVESMPRQLLVIADEFSGSVRILDKDRAFVVELPDRLPATRRRWSPLELADALPEELEG